MPLFPARTAATVTAASLATALLASTALAAEVRTRSFTFDSAGQAMAGTLYLPATHQAGQRLATVLVTGAWTSVQEQMPATYAQALAQRGIAAVTFDFRGWGRSGDLPNAQRYIEHPAAKIADIQAAVRAVAELAEVDGNALHGLGICASAGYMVDAAAQTPQMRTVSLVAPWLQTAAIVHAVYGGEAGVAHLIALSRRAEAAGGEIIPAAGPVGATGVLMPLGGYYYEPTRGAIPAYDNKWNQAGWEGWLSYRPAERGHTLRQPLAVVHSEAAAIPDGLRAFLADYRGTASALWLDGVDQFAFYDRPDAVARATDHVVRHILAR